MSDDAEIERAEKALSDAEASLGPDRMEIAERLENVAELLKSKKVRALDAANFIARAKVIREKSGSNRQSDDKGTQQSGVKTCPYCAEEIKANAILCKHCRSNLQEPPDTRTKTSQDSKSATSADVNRDRRVAAVLSFLLPGLGQVFLGNVLAGIVTALAYCGSVSAVYWGYLIDALPGPLIFFCLVGLGLWIDSIRSALGQGKPTPLVVIGFLGFLTCVSSIVSCNEYSYYLKDPQGLDYKTWRKTWEKKLNYEEQSYDRWSK